MEATTHHIDPWALLVVVAGVLASVIVFVLTSDLIWSIVPLLVMVAIVRRLPRHDDAAGHGAR